MKRRIRIFFMVAVLLVPAGAVAQYWKLNRYEAGIGGGSVHTFMDIGSPEDALRSFQFSDTRFNISSHFGYKITQDLSVKLDLNYLMIGAADSRERERSLSFTSNCMETGLRLEFNIIGGGRTFGYGFSTIYNRKGRINRTGDSYVYIFGGFGGVLSKSKVTNASGEEVIGNPSYYNNLNWGYVIPAGIGYKRPVSSYVDLAVEIGGRLSLTDRIDGYQHATASLYQDKYVTTTIKAVYKIRTGKNGLPSFSKYGRR